jgi:hypothetical protein
MREKKTCLFIIILFITLDLLRVTVEICLARIWVSCYR